MVAALKRSVIIVAIVMAGSLALTVVVLPLLGTPLSRTALIMCVVITLFLAVPISIHSSLQKERLRETLERLSEAHRLLEETARRDSLTGLANRGALFEALQAALEPSAKEGVLLMIDADEFKQINDRFGHAAGDRTLREIADAMRKTLRPDDFCARIGGEEFAVILPATTLAEAHVIAERLRDEIGRIRLKVRGGAQVTVSVSIGAAILRGGADASAVMRLADKRLYEAKKTGRNRTVLPRGSSGRAVA